MARFNELKLSPPQFSGLHYCGTRTDHGTTDFSVLKLLVQRILADSSVRSARPLGCMFSALKVSCLPTVIGECIRVTQFSLFFSFIKSVIEVFFGDM